MVDVTEVIDTVTVTKVLEPVKVAADTKGENPEKNKENVKKSHNKRRRGRKNKKKDERSKREVEAALLVPPV